MQAAAITSTDAATGTINNDDTATLSIGDLTITETNADFNVTFAVTLDHDVAGRLRRGDQLDQRPADGTTTR